MEIRFFQRNLVVRDDGMFEYEGLVFAFEL